MLFARRSRPDTAERVRIALWPRRSFARSFNYVKHRVLRLKATPHAIAVGVAMGAFASCTPFIGFHFILAFVLAWAVGGSMVAAAFGTAFGNPVTFPIIWISSFRLGEWLIGSEAGVPSPLELRLDFETLTGSFATLWPTLKLMLVGGVLIGGVVGAVLYILTRQAVLASQNMRAARLEAKRRRELAGIVSPDPLARADDARPAPAAKGTKANERA